MKLRSLAISISLLILGSVQLFSQTVTSTILGTVVDPAGASVASASVTVTNQGTAAVKTLETDGSGLFRATNIFAGQYSVRPCRRKVFKALTVKDIEINASDDALILVNWRWNSVT